MDSVRGREKLQDSVTKVLDSVRGRENLRDSVTKWVLPSVRGRENLQDIARQSGYYPLGNLTTSKPPVEHKGKYKRLRDKGMSRRRILRRSSIR